MSDEHNRKFRERWWHFGCCPRCGMRYNEWFILGTQKTGEYGTRYCYPCATARAHPATGGRE